MRKRRIERRQNPSVMDLATIVIVGGVGLFLLSRVTDLKGGLKSLLPGGDTNPDSRRERGLPAFAIGASDWDRYIRRDGLMNVTWRLRHWGAGGRYWAGAKIDCIGDGESAEQYFDVGYDEEWRDYEVRAQLRFYRLPLVPGICDLKLYVATENNQWIAEQPEFAGAVMVGM